MLIKLPTYGPENYLTIYENIEFIFRIILAAFLGLLIGLERSRRYKDAGLRTHSIIAMAAAVFMILSKYAFIDMAEVAGTRGADSARIAAQVVSGISFLGAGIIFKHGRSTVHGLTTAAGMWATAAMGLSIGAGMYCVGIFETIVLLGMQLALHRDHSAGDSLIEQKVDISMEEGLEMIEEVNMLLKSHNATIVESSQTREGDKIHLSLTCRMESAIDHTEIMKWASGHPGITHISCS